MSLLTRLAPVICAKCYSHSPNGFGLPRPGVRVSKNCLEHALPDEARGHTDVRLLLLQNQPGKWEVNSPYQLIF
jgi:hypothetical protein